jgi:hypothetical protein
VPKKAKDAELTELFTKALPDWDRDRVYVSDIKRAFAWYNILVEKGFVDGKADEEDAKNEEGEAPAAEGESAQEGGIKTRKRSRKKAADEGEAAEDDAPKAE